MVDSDRIMISNTSMLSHLRAAFSCLCLGSLGDREQSLQVVMIDIGLLMLSILCPSVASIQKMQSKKNDGSVLPGLHRKISKILVVLNNNTILVKQQSMKDGVSSTLCASLHEKL
jgi:hypothetical protein